ncbi:MAG: class I SAM-dependent methyltransferase [Deltaproteobacteria bacterium]|nr:class I SAM-dependent methyltransferase [Deltaproteobacteria bacterium]
MSIQTSLCKICGNENGNISHIAREMMFGSHEEFEYVECSQCGCLFLKDIPDDMGRYYPSGYYSMNVSNIDLFKFYLGSFAVRFYLSNSLARSILSEKIDFSKFEWMLDIAVKKNARILDVGCGAGKILLVMRHLGYSHLIGADPFITHDISYNNGVRILKKELPGLAGQFDLIMLHHSFEHMPDPLPALHELNRLLSPGGTVVLRIPLAQTHAWRTYKTHWVQLDAPRHLCLYSDRAVKILADSSGFKVDKVRYDSSGFQFWGSEQYAHNIPLMDKRSYKVSPKRSIFTNKDIREFNSHARWLNECCDGDQACFFLSKVQAPGDR